MKGSMRGCMEGRTQLAWAGAVRVAAGVCRRASFTEGGVAEMSLVGCLQALTAMGWLRNDDDVVHCWAHSAPGRYALTEAPASGEVRQVRGSRLGDSARATVPARHPPFFRQQRLHSPPCALRWAACEFVQRLQPPVTCMSCCSLPAGGCGVAGAAGCRAAGPAHS